MVRFRLNKLVRDELLTAYRDLGERPQYRVLDHDSHVVELTRKITEEANELTASSTQKIAEEIADIEQAIADLKALCGIAQEVSQIKQKKKKKKGGFKKGIYIETLDVAENDPWCDYYRRDPERFPEIP